MPFGQFPQVLAGTDYTAGFIQSIVPPTAWKSADTPRSNTTSLTADPDLQFEMVANGVYAFLAMVFASGPALGTADLKVAWSWPAGSTAAWTGLGITTASTSPNIVAVRTTSGSSNPFGVNGGETPALLWGSITCGSTAGAMALEWAQNTGNATATIMKQQSALWALRNA